VTGLYGRSVPTVRWPLRRLAAWVVLGEVLVVGAFLAAAWKIWADHQPAKLATPGVAVTSPPPLWQQTARAEPSIPASSFSPPAGSPVPSPGLDQGPPLSDRLMRLANQEAASLESLQWQALNTIVGWARAYIDRVIWPAVEKAEKAG
jgi:hypothetical protein